VYHRAGDGDALLFAAGECIDRAVRASLQPDIGKRRQAALACGPSAHPIQLEHQAHVLGNIERRNQIEKLVDEADVGATEQGARRFRERAHLQAIDVDGAAVGTIDAADQVEQCRFARAAATHDRDALAGGDLRIELIENAVDALALAEVAAELADAEHIWQCTGMSESEWRLLTTLPDLPSAQSLAEILSAEGIPVRVSSDASVLGQAAPSRLYVGAGDFYRARHSMAQRSFTDEELAVLSAEQPPADVS
jgi:hypothetical protein